MKLDDIEVFENYILRAIGTLRSEKGNTIVTKDNEYLVIGLNEQNVPLIYIDEEQKDPVSILGIENYFEVMAIHMLGEPVLDLKDIAGFVQEASDKALFIGRIDIAGETLH